MEDQKDNKPLDLDSSDQALYEHSPRKENEDETTEKKDDVKDEAASKADN